MNYFLAMAFSGIAVFSVDHYRGSPQKNNCSSMVLQVLETLDSTLICSPFFNIFLGVTLVSLILQLKVTLVALESHKVFCCCVLTWGQKSITLYPGGEASRNEGENAKFLPKIPNYAAETFVCLLRW